MAETERRIARIISLEEAKTLDVILDLENGNCADSVDCLDAAASAYGLQIRYLLVNPSRTALPGWALKGNMQVVNYKVDFNRRGRFLTETAEQFANGGADILMAVANHRREIVDKIAEISNAGLKIGKASLGNKNPYDITVRWKPFEHNRDLAADFLSNLKTVTESSNE